jgi:hypothetical protein
MSPPGRQPGPVGMRPRPLLAAPAPSAGGPLAPVSPGPLGLGASALKQRIDSNGPQLKLVGEEAMKAAAAAFAQAHVLEINSALGRVRLVPGSVWAGRRMLVYAAPLYCYFTVDDRFYEWQTWRFVQDEWFHALAEGASRAAYWESVAKAEVALVCGIFFPWYAMLGLVCAQVALVYIEHGAVVREVFDRAPAVLTAIDNLRTKHPVLFDKLLRKVATELVMNLPKGVSVNDVAFFVGRLIRGAAAAGPALTIKAMVRICLVTGTIVTATHLPSISAHVVEAEARKHAAEYQRKLSEAGYTVTLEEAEAILKDSLSRGDPKESLEALERAVNGLLPSLDQLAEALQL